VKRLFFGVAVALAALPHFASAAAAPDTTRAASTQAASEAVRFAYTAPVDCPDEARFRDEVSARTAKFHVAEENAPARQFAVVVDGDAVQATGFLEVRALDGTVSRRAVGRGSCVEVVSALALITAVAIDPDATTSAAPPGSAATSPASAGTTDPEPGPAVVPPEPPMPRLVLPVIAPPVATRAESRARAVDFAAGASVEIFPGLVPRISVGGGAFISVTPAEPRSWVPEGRLSLLAATADASFSGDVGASLLWAVARAEGCVLNAVLVRRVALGPCLGVDAGLLHSAGTGVAHRNTTTRGWFALDALARVEWEPFTSTIIDIGGGITVPLRRYPFSYGADTGQDTVLYRLPAVAGVANLGLGYRFR
jgi:hypothetical protein